MENDTILDQILVALDEVPNTFKEGDEVIAAISPKLDVLKYDIKKQKVNFDDIISQRDKLIAGNKKIQDDIIFVSQENGKKVKPVQQTKTEQEQIRELMEAAKGRNIFG